MTTSTETMPVCLTPERCETCSHSRDLHSHHTRPSYEVPIIGEREPNWCSQGDGCKFYAPHTHSLECSIRFHHDVLRWRVCTNVRGLAPVWLPPSKYGDGWFEPTSDPAVIASADTDTVPDILGDPSSDASRLAAFTVLEEVERRGMTLNVAVHDDGTYSVTVTEQPDGWPQGAMGYAIAEFPRAFALGLWAAVQAAERSE